MRFGAAQWREGAVGAPDVRLELRREGDVDALAVDTVHSVAQQANNAQIVLKAAAQQTWMAMLFVGPEMIGAKAMTVGLQARSTFGCVCCCAARRRPSHDSMESLATSSQGEVLQSSHILELRAHPIRHCDGTFRSATSTARRCQPDKNDACCLGCDKRQAACS